VRYLIVIVILFRLSGAEAAPVEDAYIEGYAASILQREFKLANPELNVKNGILKVRTDDLKGTDRARLMEALSSIPGVAGVETLESGRQLASTPPASSGPWIYDTVQPSGQMALQTGFLPEGHLFKRLLADPRWPHFSAAYHYTSATGDFEEADNIATVSFGETIPFYRGNLSFGRRFAGQWEVGIQGGVFSDFNLDAPSSDLINSDFFGAVYSSARVGDFSAFARLFHQSSHVGDEFLLRTRLQRVNLSFEGIDLKLSYEFPYGIRLYGGGGGLFRKEPASLKPWSVQYGVEFRSPWRLDFAAMRPIAAVDLKNYEENDWQTDVSARAGVQFENLDVMGRHFQILLEYFNGHSPSGQFYVNKMEYVGLGAHFHF
jgi:hypothetical protein